MPVSAFDCLTFLKPVATAPLSLPRMFTSVIHHNVPAGQVAVSTGISWARKHTPDDTQGI